MLVLSYPIHYVLELTPQCNNNCIGCGNVFSEKNTSILSADQWHTILNKISPHVSNLRISGGEPTLHPEFEFIIKTIDKLNIPIVLFTNARWKNPNRIISLFSHSQTEQDLNRGLLISLHGNTPEIHDAFTRVKGSFNETVQNIRRAVAAGLNVATSTIITKANYLHVNNIIDFTTELGIERAFFARYIPVQNNAVTPDVEQLKHAIHIVETRRKNGAKVEFSVCIPQCFAPSSSEGCLSGVTYCVIDPYGNVRPCTHTSLICGNLMDQSVEDIWHGADMQQWRNMIPPQCHDCLELPQCHGGCRAAAMLENTEKDPLIGDPILEKSPESFEALELYEGAYLTANFTIRPEPFGYILIHGSRVIPVSHQAKPILDILDGSLTLRQIADYFGQEALNFIGTLYQKGLVELMEEREQEYIN